MPRQDLKLNSIRYTKESSRLVLEEHGHCEVPAGCGGVVLRWRLHSQVPVEVWVHSHPHVQVSIYLDGVALTSARPLVEPGDHVFAFRVTGLNPGEPALMFAGVYDEKQLRDVKISPTSPQTVHLASLADGTWKYSTENPLEDFWMTPGYDDSHWRRMISREFPEESDDDPARYRIEKVRELGGRGLGIDEPAPAIIVRKSFTLSIA